MKFSLQEATAAIPLQSKQVIKKEWEKSIAKALSMKDGKNILPRKERHDNCKLFSVCHSLAVYLQTKLKPEYLPQTYGGGILPWPQISFVGVATLD